MNDRVGGIQGIACSVFRREIEALQKAGRISTTFTYLDSMLHMDPARLHELMDESVAAAGTLPSILAYGECQPFIDEVCDEKRARRLPGINCVEILLGKEKYRELRKKGIFFLLPEWTLRWREAFEVELGLKGRNARDFMGEMHSSIVYLDTGCLPVPRSILREIEDFSGLKVEVMAAPLDHLAGAIKALE